ncbi:MAG: hypothetical protein Q8934_22285 [Bacillota bacterium]|nr:hypothetical protein [Bacillota bacterium]
MKEQNSSVMPNEEFSIEFGDVNGIKLYELPFMTQKDQKKTSAEKKK